MTTSDILVVKGGPILDEVESRTEVFTVAGQHNHPYFFILVDILKALLQVQKELVVHGIQFLGAIQPNVEHVRRRSHNLECFVLQLAHHRQLYNTSPNL